MSNLLFKSQLQDYARKACLSAPVYEITKDGPPHMPSFKASVTVNGVRYESYDCPEGFRNRKTAEHAAAQVALQELRKGTNGAGIVTNPVYETGLCKNLLQEYAQKLSLPVPSYSCSKIGEGNATAFTAVVEIAGISYQGGPGNSKKVAEIKAARTALSAIHAQQAFQAFNANRTITHSDAFGGTWNSHPEVHAGMKREYEFDQPSGRRKGKKNKRPKSLRKKGIIQGSTDKDEILGESSSKAAENGQQTAAIATNVDDQDKNLQEDISMDEAGQTKLEERPCSQETGQTTENTEQSVEDVIVSVVGKLQNNVGDIASNPVGNDEKGKQEMNEDTDKVGDIATNVDDQDKNLQEDISMDEGGQTKLEEGPCSQETGQTTENTEQSVEDVTVSVVGELQNKVGDIASNPVGNDEKRKQEMNEDTNKVGHIATNVDDQYKNLQEDISMDDGGQTKLEEGPCYQETGQTTENTEQSVEDVTVSVVGELQNKVGDIASNPVGNDEKGKQEMNEDTDKVGDIATNVDDQYKNLQEDISMDEGGQTKLEEGSCSQATGLTTENTEQSVEDVTVSVVGELQNKVGDIASNPVGNDEKGKQEMNEDTEKYSVDKKGQNEHEITNPVIVDALKKCEHDKNESNQTLQELQEPLEKEDLKKHETPENLNQGEVALPL